MYKILKNKIEARRQNRMNSAVQDFLLNNPIVLSDYQISSLAIETALQIDVGELAQEIEIDSEDVAYHICASDVADYISVDDVADHICVYDVAQNMNVDAEDVAEHICSNEVAEIIQDSMETPELNIDDLNIDIDDIVQQVIDQLDLSDIVNQVCEEIASRIEG